MNQLEELRERLSKIDISLAVSEYIEQSKQTASFNLAAFDEKHIYKHDCGFWSSSSLKKPTLLELEKCYADWLIKEKERIANISWNELRVNRNKRLRETDWTQLPDVPITTKLRGVYREYRKYLRNKPTDYKDETVKDWKIQDFEEFKKMNYPE